MGDGELKPADLEDFCEDTFTNQQMGKTRSITNQTLAPNDAAIPCGIIAKNFFNGKNLQFRPI